MQVSVLLLSSDHCVTARNLYASRVQCKLTEELQSSKILFKFEYIEVSM